jgi:hypothetical protein
VNVSKIFKRIIGGDQAVNATAASLRNAVVWGLIARVAAFLTQPSSGPASAFDAPVPWPAELGLDNTLGM